MGDELIAARVARENDNLNVKPVDLLRAMAEDIEKGRLQVDGLVLLYANRPKGEAWDYGSYICGMTSDQEIIALVMAQERAVRRWRKG